MKKTGLISDIRYVKHNPGAGHPECAQRYHAVIKGINELVAEERLIYLEPRLATEKEIQLCHTASYINKAKTDIANGMTMLSTGDTNVCEDSYHVALLAAGGLLVAVDSVIKGECRNAFCNVRPPGHHASSQAGMGFCIFNNVAIAARYAQTVYNIEKVLIVDWDIHHGNGTQDIFYDDPSVFYFSIHSWPFYPGSGRAHETGIEEGKGYTMNCPLSAGACGTDVINAFNQKLVPAMKSFKPDLVMISAGFDSRIGDLIGNFAVQDEDFVELTRICMNLADEYCNSRLVSTLEGGYHLSGLASVAGLHVKTLSS